MKKEKVKHKIQTNKKPEKWKGPSLARLIYQAYLQTRESSPPVPLFSKRSKIL